MNVQSPAKARSLTYFSLAALCVLSAITFVGSRGRADAAAERPPAADPTLSKIRLPDRDIRTERTAESVRFIGSARLSNGRNASRIAEIRAGFQRGEAKLRATVADLRIEYNDDLQVPEVIGTDIWRPVVSALTPPADGKRSEILRRFVRENGELVGLTAAQAASLRVTADYANPDGVLSFAHLEQRINGVPVFRGEIKAGFSRDGRIIRVINNLAPGVDPDSVTADFRSPADAALAAARHIGHEFKPAELILNRAASTGNRTVFGSGDWATTAEKMYFPTEPGVAVPAWRVLIWEPVNAYYVIVDAASGTMLWRKNITEEQSASATFSVYGNLTSPMMTADSPTPFSPGCPDPNNCAQPPIVDRQAFSLVGNEGVNAFNNLGWIPDTGLPVRMPADPNITDGNNVEAGIDRDGSNGIDPQGHAVGNPTRVFSYSYNPAPGNPPPGDNPVPPIPQTYPPAPFQQGSTAHGFYLVNRWHDEMYKAGFTEQAGNFQHFNFGRGGVEGDRLSLEVQDSTGTNGANFSTPSDGGRGRMQNFIWTGGTPGRDGTLDSTTVLHEITHGLSNRLHGNVTGLNTNIARSMGEGWSDFYALALLSQPTDDPCGIYPISAYLAYEIIPGYANHYYGIRRFPAAKIGCTGPNGFPFNPLTFGNLNAGNCTTFQSAYPRGPIGSGACDQVNNAGEVWTLFLWETRGVLIDRHGPVEGNRRVLQYTTDAMKLSPLNPTFLQSRDAIIAAAAFGSPGDSSAVREGFRRRGMGYSAGITSTSPLVVVEAFDFAPGQYVAPFDFDGDGRTDISIYRPSEGNWYIQRSTQGFTAIHWGIATDKIVPADYDGDGKTDLAVFRKGENSTWYIFNSATSTVRAEQFGATNIEQAILFDTAVPADYDGDGKADLAVWRLTDFLSEPARFVILQSSNGQTRSTQWGSTGDAPVPADYDGDLKADLAIYRPGLGQWWIRSSLDSLVSVRQFGTSSDKAVPADYTGDGKADIAVWRPSTGEWFVLRSEFSSYYAFPFGAAGDMPVPGDYDGDGKADAAVFRPSNSTWYANRSTAGVSIQQFGTIGDVPVPNEFVR